MNFNATVDLGTIVSALAFFSSSAVIFFSWRRHANNMDFTLQQVQKELTSMQAQLEKLAEVTIMTAVHDERFKGLERRLDALKCSDFKCPP